MQVCTLVCCCFTVLSNQNSQGLRGVTTVCLVYNAGRLCSVGWDHLLAGAVGRGGGGVPHVCVGSQLGVGAATTAMAALGRVEIKTSLN